MQLAFGKNASISLTPLPLASQMVRGERTFFGAGNETTQRAGAIVNEVLRSTFEKSTPTFASDAERAAIGAEKVDVAAFRDDESGAIRVVYREIVIQFEPRTPAAARRKLLDRYGLRLRTRSSFALHKIIAFDPNRRYVAGRMVDLANELTATEEVAFAFPNFVSEFRRDAVPPVDAAQWHLRTVHARDAWATTLGSPKVAVAVLDDGVDVDHPNLKARIKRRPDPNEPRDKHGRDFFVAEDAPDHFDPRPKRFKAPYDVMTGNDIHGTPCAGVIAARGTSEGMRGIAPNCRVLPVKVFHADDLAVEARVADAIRYAMLFADVLSCSWSGPRSPDIEAALADGATGRDGRGVPVFAATGNSHPDMTGVSYPAASPHAIGVGASTDRNDIAHYSQRGPEVSVVAPSSGGNRAITTTDVSYRDRGFNLGNAGAGGVSGLHTNSFGGTSSATPLAAGIAALMLSASSELTRDQVKQLLQQTAAKIGPAGSYDANGFSQIYGFGCVNAAAAVAAAQAARRTAVASRRRARRAA
ncbi:MAG TPA: S8 family serine peptidase [Geminicoccaceae bacterium]|nr:S8 family serine peptidase [Geminicoccaceae bacterium]